MNLKFQNFLLVFFLIAAFSIGGFLSGRLSTRTAEETSTHERIHWETSFNAALQKAKTSRRVLFIDFYADWCGFCKEMDKTTYQNPNVIRLSSRLVCARIDVDKNEELTRRFQIDGLPTLVFMTPENVLVKRVDGYIPPGPLISILLKLTK